MKQTFLAIIGIFIVLSIFAVVAGLNDLMQQSRENNTSLMSGEDSCIEDESPVPGSKSNAKKVIHKTPTSTPKSRKLFLQKTVAAIKKVKTRLDAEYKMVYELSLKESLTPEEEATIEKLKKRYKVKGYPCLLKRLHTHPVSIVIAQAALESGWGSSRFYREANNIFGVWSYNPDEPRIAAGIPREGQKTVYVKKYPNLEASIEGYFRMVAKGNAYKKFRTARLHTDNPFEIISYLNHYSELRHEYVRRLYYMIKSNKFYELDDPRYQPPGWERVDLSNKEYLIPKKDDPAAMIADLCQKKAKVLVADINLSAEKDSSEEVNITALPQEALSTVNRSNMDMEKTEENNGSV